MQLPDDSCALLHAIWSALRNWLVPAYRRVAVPVVIPVAAPRRRRSGFTLVEMMVSVTLSLVVVFALVSVFELIGTNVTETRAMIEMSGNLRSAATLLQQDLEGATVVTLPPRAPEQGEGYLEIADGPSTDRQHLQAASDGTQRYLDLATTADSQFADTDGDGFLDVGPTDFDTTVGDVDDVLLLTTRSDVHPFVGKVTHPMIRLTNGGLPIASKDIPIANIESNLAEVCWWMQADPNAASAVGTPVRSLRRRVLLVRPDLDLSNVFLRNQDELTRFMRNNDISVKIYFRTLSPATFGVEANSLGDLTRRENRLGRWRIATERRENGELFYKRLLVQTTMSYAAILRHASLTDDRLEISSGTIPGYAGEDYSVPMQRQGQDIVLGDALAFDLQVYDPMAPVVLAADGSTVTPSDPGYVAAYSVNSIVSRGAFVDLGWGVSPKSLTAATKSLGQFSDAPHPKSQLLFVAPTTSDLQQAGDLRATATYCTWCDLYERDGVDQRRVQGLDWTKVPDEGTNGLDDNNQLGVDDPSEKETSPPYPHPLRGVSVKLRAMDFSTRQVRQTSVAVDFLPE